MTERLRWFGEDTVRVKGTTESKVVVRAWNDASEDFGPNSDYPESLPPLSEGQVEIVGPLVPGSTAEVFTDSELELLDRQYLPGDLARDPQTGNTGVILKIKPEVRLRTVVSDIDLPDWVSADTVVPENRIVTGDVVVADNWVGQVEGIFQEALVEDADGREPYRICDVDRGVLTVGASAESIKEQAGAFFSLDMPGHFPDPKIGRVMDLKQGAVAVNWLAINQMLPAAAQDISRPKRIWTDLENLTQVTSRSRSICSVGDKVYPLTPSSSTGVLLSAALGRLVTSETRFMVIIDRRSKVDVRWMDGTVTEDIPSTTLEVGEFADDEHDAFPGEVAVWEAEGEKKVAIIQNVDAKRRVTTVRWWGSEETAVVSSLELDPNGKPPLTYGCRRGDIVMLSGDALHTEFPDVPRIGEADESMSPDAVRTQLQRIGFNHAKTSGNEIISFPKTGPDAADVRWIGTVYDLLTDGSVVLELPSGEKVQVRHDRLYIYMDHRDVGGGPMGAPADEMMSEDGSTGSWLTEGEGDEVEVEEGEVVEMGDIDWADSGNEAEAEDPMEMDGDGSGCPTPQPTLPKGVFPNGNAGVSAPPEPLLNGLKVPGASSSVSEGLGTAPLPPTHSEASKKDTPWKPFLTLEEAPQSHHFYAQEQVKAPRKFLGRLQKEYAALESSLPENIIARAYEDRTDLLRACIIGSTDTPYEDACFVFDLYLPPARFPQEPPSVYFHSWTNGGGRIQPNLYEDGKVCLSVLGTWQGDSTESWSAARSSLLQVLVSISGLCLVKDPYFNEPGFEKHRGTASGRVAANLYSERAYVLTRGFVKHVLEYPVPGLDEELRWLYLHGPPNEQGKLPDIVAKARRLIEESDRANAEGSGSSADEVAAAGTLTLGGAIPLKRTLAVLEKHLPAPPSTTME